MKYRFDKNLTQTVKTYDKWWKGELDRPLIPVIVYGYERDMPEPKHGGGCSQHKFANRDISVSEIVDCIEYELSGFEFLGDAFPIVNMYFSGPGIVAAFLGAKLTVADYGIWFFSENETDIADMHFEYDPGNYWLNRIKDITVECKKRFGNEMVLAIPDLGGAIDILASLRGTHNLLTDFYDAPEEVKRLINEISGLWHIYFEEIAALHGKDKVYSAWSSILSSESSYIFQADFAYMLGPDMYNEFILPELEYSFSKVKNACYHLDGIGNLTHLDSLVKAPDLKLIQWVPGDGAHSENHWIDVYSKILDSGKLLQMAGPFEPQADKIIEKRGSLKGVLCETRWIEKKDRDKWLQILENYS
jgi:5-methyltetrahydrofolate--homocysteine methyltransferase